MFDLKIIEFSDWLQRKLDERKWSYADLARNSRISPAQITRLMSGERGIGPKTCKAIARALRIPPETVFRQAGLLPPANKLDAKRELILFLADQLPDEEYEDLVAYINMRIDRARERNKIGGTGGIAKTTE